MHLGLLSFEDLIPTPMKTSAQLSRKQTGESIPSFNADATAGLAFGILMACRGALRASRCGAG